VTAGLYVGAVRPASPNPQTSRDPGDPGAAAGAHRHLGSQVPAGQRTPPFAGWASGKGCFPRFPNVIQGADGARLPLLLAKACRGPLN
jgi:hypothetical protein